VIRKRGGSLQVQVFAGRDPLTGRKRWLSRQVRGQTKAAYREAKKVEAQLLEQLDRGEQRGSRTRTVGELVERWLEWRQQVRPISPVTVANYRGATAECGAAPVTKASGKSKAVTFGWAANTKARNALATFAGNSRHSSPWAAKVYADARRRGKHHPHAVRILARAWLRVMWACWHNDTIYDPARHGAERRLAART
jgi:hypothetical protein